MTKALDQKLEAATQTLAEAQEAATGRLNELAEEKEAAEQKLAEAQEVTNALEAKVAAAEDRCEEAKAAAPTTAPSRTIGVPLTDSSAAHDGYMSVDIDGNRIVNYADAVSFFVATTMRSFGAANVLKHFRTRLPAKHAPMRTVDQIMVLMNEAAAAAATKRD